MSSSKPKGIPVSELFDNLVVEYRSGGPPHSVLFQTALKVCAEDSRRVQRGEPPSSLRALAQRAHSLIKDAYPNSAPASVTAGALQGAAEPAPVRFAGRPPSSSPFDADSTPAPAAPAAASPGAPQPEQVFPNPDTAPRLPASLPPGMRPAPGPPASEPAGAKPTVPTPSPAAPEDGPFDHTPAPIAAASVPTFLTLEDPPAEEKPRPRPPVPVPPQPSLTFEDIMPAENAFGQAEEPASERRGLPMIGRIATIAIALLAAVVAVVILWPGVARKQPVATRIVESFPAPTPTVPAADLAAALRVPAEPTATAVPATPPPTPTQKPAEPRVSPAAPRPRRAAPAEVDGGIETMRSPDWSGRPAVFVVHFSSYRSHENATADASRLARELGRPAHAVVVDLGERGTWYRVVVGEFATAADARAFRAEIAPRRPGEVSSVYRLAAP